MLLAAAADPTRLLLCVALGVLGLIVLVARFKLNSILALIVASLFVGITSGMNLPDIASAFQQGVGKVLADIAMVVGLGTVLGKLLAESGGAQVVADTLIQSLGQQRLPWAMMLVAFIVGLPVFFAVGLVLLAPILFTVARQSGTPLLQLGLPLVAALSVAHGLVPPHPGPMAAMASLRGADGHWAAGRRCHRAAVAQVDRGSRDGPAGRRHRRCAERARGATAEAGFCPDNLFDSAAGAPDAA